MPEVIGASLSPGAGRFRDWTWPDPNQLDSVPDLKGYSRQAGVNNGGGAIITNFGGGASQVQLGSFNGIECASLTSSATGGTGLRFDGIMNAHIRTGRNAPPASANDEQFLRVYCTMAPFAAPNVGRDMSFSLSEGGNGSGDPWTGPGVGFGFRFVDALTVNFFARGPNGLVETAVQTNSDVTQWHTYEMRISGATATADAALEARIDGLVIALPAAFSSWAAGTNLPASQVRSNRCGFRASLKNFDSKVNFLQVAQLRYMSALTALALL